MVKQGKVDGNQKMPFSCWLENKKLQRELVKQRSSSRYHKGRYSASVVHKGFDLVILWSLRPVPWCIMARVGMHTGPRASKTNLASTKIRRCRRTVGLNISRLCFTSIPCTKNYFGENCQICDPTSCWFQPICLLLGVPWLGGLPGCHDSGIPGGNHETEGAPLFFFSLHRCCVLYVHVRV